MLPTLIILFIISMLLSILAVTILVVLVYIKVPFVRSPRRVVETVLKEINLEESDVVYDLGCGDGRILRALAKQFNNKMVGYEISPWAYFLARFYNTLQQTGVEFRYKNFYKDDLSEATVVFCFLLDSVMPKVGEQLERQLKPGSTVISFTFKIPQWKSAKIIQPFPEKKKGSKLYIYQR